MSKKLAGRASVFAIDGTLAYTGVATIDNEVQAANMTDEFDVVELMDRRGEVIGKAARNRRRTLTIDFIPTDASTSNPQTEAGAKANVAFPDKLALVTLASFGITDIDGDWNYVGGGTVGMTAEGYIRMTLTLARNGDTPAALTPI